MSHNYAILLYIPKSLRCQSKFKRDWNPYVAKAFKLKASAREIFTVCTNCPTRSGCMLYHVCINIQFGLVHLFIWFTVGDGMVPLPFGHLRTLVRHRTRDQHNNQWLHHGECRQAKEALPTIDGRVTRKLLKLNKLQLRTVTAALTGHGSFNKHLSVLGVTDSPLCRACLEVDETAGPRATALPRGRHLQEQVLR